QFCLCLLDRFDTHEKYRPGVLSKPELLDLAVEVVLQRSGHLFWQKLLYQERSTILRLNVARSVSDASLTDSTPALKEAVMWPSERLSPWELLSDRRGVMSAPGLPMPILNSSRPPS